MKAQVLVFVLIVGLVLPGVVSAASVVPSAPPQPTRTHIIKSVYFGWTAVLNHAYVVEFYWSPVTKTVRVQRGPFQTYDSYTRWIGYVGPWFFFKLYLG